MSKNQMNSYLCAVLSTLLAMEGHSAPETPIYMALGCDMGVFGLVKQTLCTAGLCTSEAHTLTLTDNGVSMAKQVDAFAAQVSGR
jgi:hypothetical protein